MSADQLLYPMDNSSNQNDWYDFENFFEFPSDSSNSTSVNSISPKDLDLTYTDVDGPDWTFGAHLSSQSSLPELVNYETPFEEYIEQALVSSDLNVNPNDFLQFPPPSPKEDLVGSTFDVTRPSESLGNVDPFYSTIRHMVESQAAIDYRSSSKKEKRREAAITVHLERLHNTPMLETEFLNNFPSPSGSDPTRGSFSHGASSVSSDVLSKSPTPASGSDVTPGGMELVLDLNMNTPANMPKKQKPRSRAQKENYIKVRKHGACEKHRKQHKRCNCLNINASRLNVNDTTLLLTNTSVQPIKQPNLEVRGFGHGRVLPTTPRQPDVSPNIQPARLRVGDQNRPDSVVPLDQRHVHPGTFVVSPDTNYGRCSSGVPGQRNSTNTGQPRPLVHQPDTTLYLATPQVPSSRLSSLCVGPNLPDTGRASPGTTRLDVILRNIATCDVPGLRTMVTRRPDQLGASSAAGRQVTCGDVSSRHIHSSSVLADAVGNSPLISNVGSAVNLIMAVVSSVLPPSPRPWAGGFLSRFVVFSSRQFLLARKGLGLY
ncbi:hypothetical protein FE257_006415 [Aspergillus nanangensis]|uniref:Uncharacterized protein n=1 Tax=Aspergillus nanangensis TaxID=2582783 RepID=A0AAD4CXH4_ASPNN|nr:hypothetical protein FE257_006415 [Aspergillus nanangensis]